MLVKNQLHLEWELVKWIALMTLALSVALALATQVAAVGPDREPAEPGLLSNAITEAARPMNDSPLARQPLPHVPPPDYGDALRLIDALACHDAGEVEAALEGWQAIDLPPDMHPWKLLAMSAAHLQAGELGEALQYLHEVRDLDPENPLVSYYLGVARLTQAERAADWYDAVGPTRTRFVAHVPDDISPNSKGMYQLAAQMHFERAIAWKDRLDLDRPLLGVEWVVPDEDEMAMPLVVPTVRDLLQALCADDFEGHSHQVLGTLHLDRGALETAERHFDQANDFGRRLGDEYRELGKQFQAREQYEDAARAYLKSLEHGGGLGVPLHKVMENLGRALLDV